MTRLTVRLLGSFQANLDGKPVTLFESDKVRALLAYLMVESGEVHRRDKLAGMLWADMPESRARSNLSQALYNLRHLLNDQTSPSPFLIPSRETILFNPDSDYWLDVSQFTHLLEELARHNHGPSGVCESCVEKLESAAELYRGDFLEGLSFAQNLAIEEWCLVSRARYSRQVLEALIGLTSHYGAHGEIEKALQNARRQVDLDPLSEAAHRQLMRLLEASDQRSQAVAQFKRLQALLAEELDVQPERETIELYERIRAAPIPGKPEDTRRHNLPAPLTPFIGRRAELAELQSCFKEAQCRLLTILGPGGSGKTRLALETARMNLAGFQHGVFFVALNPLQTSQAIIPAVIEAIQYPIQEKGDARSQLNSYLRDKNLLLVMDGFEHLLDGADLLADILHAAPQVKILVTSRARLNIKGEHIYNLPGMRYPEGESRDEEVLNSDAVQLFLDGAIRVRADYQPMTADIEHIHSVCRQVQGMPLGILLASSWLASVEAEEIAAEIERGLDFLSSDWEDVPARQRSLRATFDHSWDLLNPRERAIFKNLSVFRGGFSRTAARAVAGASPHELRALVNKSLLLRRSPGRYEVHELLRQYAEQKQAKSAEVDLSVHEKHGIYYCDALAAWGERLISARQEDALAEMDIELENIRVAWNWAVRQRIIPHLDRMLEALCLYYDLRVRYPEGESACREVIDKLRTLHDQPEAARLAIEASGWRAHFLRQMGRHEQAAESLAEDLAALDSEQVRSLETQPLRAFLLLEMGSAWLPSDRSAARRAYEESLALYQQIGDPWQQARALAGLGMVAHHTGTFEEALQFYQRSLALYEETGDPKATAGVLIELGHNSLRMGLLDQGEAYVRRGCEYYQKVGDRASLAEGLFHLPRMYFWRGDFSAMLAIIDEVRPVFAELGWIERYVFNLTGKCFVLALAGDYENAHQEGLQGLAAARREKYQRFEAVACWGLGITELGAGNISKAGEYLQRSVDLYRSIEQTDELGWALACLAYAHLGLRDFSEFKKYVCEALQLGINVRALFTLQLALPAASLYLLQRSHTDQDQSAIEDVERAVALYNLARCYPTAANAPWFEDVAGKAIAAAAAASLPSGDIAAAQQRGRNLDLWQTAGELLEELG